MNFTLCSCRCATACAVAVARRCADKAADVIDALQEQEFQRAEMVAADAALAMRLSFEEVDEVDVYEVRDE